MKIIDFEKHGNVVRFFLGEDDLSEWYGDDWDDVPYEYNAEEVYSEFVSGWFDVAWDAEWSVLEPRDGTNNSRYCKDDMRKQKVPCIILAVPDEDDWCPNDFDRHVGSVHTMKVYFGMKIDLESLQRIGVFMQGKVLRIQEKETTND